MNAEMISVIEGAYLSGFEPSSDTITGSALYEEAEDFLYNIAINQ